MSAGASSKKKGAKTEPKDLAAVERMVVNAIKAPKILNFEEILVLDMVKEIQTSNKELFAFIDLLVTKDMAGFKKQLASHKALMQQQKIDEALVVQKK